MNAPTDQRSRAGVPPYLEQRVLAAIERFNMFAPDQRVGVAVSGGGDSVCLLHVLHQLAPKWNLHLHVLHIDHGIRGVASHTDAEFVRDLAAAFALPFHLRRADVPAAGGNIEQTARRIRHDFYRELLAGAVDRVATGHTRSDQAETVLYRFLRGSGLAGLSGIRPITAEGLVRPLLYITRAAIHSWLEQHGICWREDETNADRSYARNRIRHDLLPQLRREYNPGLDDVLANTAEVARDEDEWWRTQLDRRPGVLRLDELEHPAVARRLIRQSIEAAKGDLRKIGFDHIEAILDLARSAKGSGRIHIPGIDVTRSFDWIKIAPAGTARPVAFHLPVSVPGAVDIPGGCARIKFLLEDRQNPREGPEPYDTLVNELDWQRIASHTGVAHAGSGVLELRNWRPGDQYLRLGQSQGQKIKTLFQQWRIPLWERYLWPILTCSGQIAWSRRFGPAAVFAAHERSRVVLRIRDEASDTASLGC